MQRGNNKQFGVVFVQMNTFDTKEKNLTHAVRLIRDACNHYQPKLVVLPECFNTDTKWNTQKIVDSAEMIPNGETTNILSNLAKELNIYLVGGSIVERDDKNNLYNTTTVFDQNGNLIAKYRKLHLFNCDFDEKYDNNDTTTIKLRETDLFKNGNNLKTFDMDGIKVGLGIGYDLSFGELARLYRKDGCEMLIYPANYPKHLGKLQWDQLNRTRAIDNQMFVIGVSKARNDSNNLIDLVKNQNNQNTIFDMNKNYDQGGRSMVTDFRGRVLARAGDDEDVVCTWLDFNDLKKCRDQHKLFNNRRTDKYDVNWNN